MTDTPTPEAVEPMTDGEIAAERHYLSLGGGIAWPSRSVARIFATIDALKARALPAPRRYTGGPLEDGLYLWRPALWGAGDWASIDTSTLTGRYDIKEIVEAEAEVWLIGPIPVPDLPGEEAANG